MRISSKLALGFGAVVLTFAVAGGLIWWNLGLLRSADDSVSDGVSFNEVAFEYRHAAQSVTLGAAQMAAGSAMGEQRIREGVALMTRSRAALKSRMTSGAAKVEVQELERLGALTDEATARVVSHVRAKATATVVQQDLAFLSARADALSIRLEALVDDTREDLASTIARSAAIGAQARVLTIYALGTCLLLAIAAAALVARGIAAPLRRLAATAGRVALGDVEVEIPIEQSDEVGQVQQAFAKVVESFRTLSDAARRIAAGDTNVLIVPRSEADALAKSMMRVVVSLNGITNEVEVLSSAAVAGKLDARGRVDQFHGAYRVIVEGVNQTLDAVIGPLNVAAEYVDRISKGDIPPKITDQYNGDFNEIKNNLNQAIDAVNELVADANRLSAAAVEGKLGARADASKHRGDFRRIVAGVNETLDAVVGPLNVAAEYLDRISKGDIPPRLTEQYNGDFNAIKNNLNLAVDAVSALVGDATMLARAATDGRLATRADASKHQGDFRRIVAGVNETLDAVIGPLRVAADYVDRISKGDIPPKLTDEYSGDFNTLKNNLDRKSVV